MRKVRIRWQAGQEIARLAVIVGVQVVVEVSDEEFGQVTVGGPAGPARAT